MKIVIEIAPMPWHSYRSVRRYGRTFAYVDKKYTQWKKHVYVAVLACLNRHNKPVPLYKKGVPVRLDVIFFLTKPKYLCKERYMNARHVKKPDRSNLLKGLEDALTGVLWHDDSQIYAGSSEKRYTVDKPRIEITIRSGL